MRFLFFIAIFPLFFTGQQGHTEYLDPDAFLLRSDSEVYRIIVDARVWKEYRKVRIKDAINVEKMADLKLFADTLDRATPLYVYCNEILRSQTVADYLEGEGFRKIYLLDGGLRTWMLWGLPVDKSRKRR